MADTVLKTPASHESRPPVGGKGGKESVLWAILRGLARRWKQAVALGMVGAVAVGLAIWLLLPPPVPIAAARLLTFQKPPTALAAEHPDPPIDRQTQAEVIKSRLVLNAAIRPPEINSLPVIQAEEDPLDWLSSRLKVEFLGPEIIRISLSNEDAEQARILVDAIKDSYLQNIVNQSLHERSARLKRLNEMAEAQEKLLKRKRDSIRDLARDGAGSDSERRLFQQRLLQDQISAARAQLVRVESEFRSAKLREEILAVDAPIEVTDSLLDRYVDQDTRVLESAKKLKSADALFQSFREAAVNPKSEDVSREEAKVVALRKEHKELRERLRSEVRDQVQVQTKSERAAKLQIVRQDNLILDQQVKQLKAELDEYGKTLSDSRIVSQDLDPIRFDIKQAEDLLGRIRNALVSLTIEQDTPPRVVEMEKAVIVRVDATRRKLMITGGGALAALAVVFLLVGVLEFRKRRVESTESISQGLGLRVFGTVPKPAVRPLRWWKSDRPEYAVHVQSEAISCTRTMLLHGEGLSAHRVFLVTSPVSGEGKTTLTVQLGGSVAGTGRSTLLVDGDLRNPSVHERLGLPAGPGLCEILRGEATVFDVIQKTPVRGMMLIQAGRWTAETAQSLVSNHLGHLFAVWRDQFELVLVDSSPALPVADALIMARHADGVILSLLQGFSRVSQASEACDRFTSLGVRVSGVVLNGTAQRVYADKYYPSADYGLNHNTPVSECPGASGL